MRRLAAVAVLACVSLAGAAFADPLDDAMQLARRTLAFVERSAPRPQFAAELAALEKRAADARKGQEADRQALYAEIRQLRRRIILSHPLLDFDKLLIDKRTSQLPEHMCDQYLGRHSRPGPGLTILESWKDNPKATPLLPGRLPAGCTLQPDLSFDGQRVLFAFCDDTTPRRSELRGYFIYEAALDGSFLRQLTGTPSDPMIGARGRQTVLIEDFAPCYLPDGGFAFISTRSQQFGRCHGGRYVPSYTLYRADADGSNIRPLSYNESNEWGPSVLHDGSIVYTRWDYVNRHDTIFQSLWTTRPDGTNVGHYYGNYSRSPCFIGEAKAIPGSRKVVATAAAHHGQTLGSIIVIDPYKGQDDGLPLTAVTPEFPFPEASVPKATTMTPRPLPEPAPSPLLAPADRKARRESRPENRAATPWPLSEDLFLVAYPHGPELAIYLVDTLGGRELIYADPAISCFNPIPIRPRPTPPVLSSAIAGHESESTGRFFVQDVYQSTAPIERGTIRRMRINEIISQPTRSFPPRSFADNEVVKRILGTVAVADDGSVAFEAPACTLLQLQLLDANGMAVMTMRSGVYLQPGEQASCVGCHERRSSSPVPPTRPTGVPFQRIVPSAGPHYAGGFSFVRTVQPVLDRYCITCHGLDKTEGALSLLGTPEDSKKGRFPASYDALATRRGWVAIAQRNSESVASKPNDYFAHAGRLAQFLLDGHPDKAGNKVVALDRESFQRVADWLDLNAQCYGDYSFNRVESRQPSPEGEKALRAAIEKRFGASLAKQPYAALVNVALPTESRILQAPLAKEAGGWGQIPQGGWSTPGDPAYKEMLALVEASITPLTRMDIAGTCGSDGHGGCRCGCCWVRQAREMATAAARPTSPSSDTASHYPLR